MKINSFDELFNITKNKSFKVLDPVWLTDKGYKEEFLEPDIVYKLTKIKFGYKLSYTSEKSTGYSTIEHPELAMPTEIVLVSKDNSISLKNRSIVNTVVLPMFIDYLKSHPVNLTYFMGNYFMEMDNYMEKHNPEIYSGYNYNYDFIELFGKEWYKVTVYAAVDIVKGKGYAKEWAFLNSKASLHKRYSNPKYFDYDIDGKVIYNEKKENSMKRSILGVSKFVEAKMKKQFNEEYDEYIYTEVLPVVEDIMEDNKDTLSKFEFHNNSGEVELTTGESHDGFSSSTEGTANFLEYTDLQYLWSSGYMVSNKKVAKELEDSINDSLNDAKKEFIKKYKKELEEAGIEDNDITYNELTDAGFNDLAEELSEMEYDYVSSELTFAVHVYFRKNNHGKDPYNCYVFSEICLGTYYRFGSGITVFEDEFDFSAGEDISKDLEKIIKEAFDALE